MGTQVLWHHLETDAATENKYKLAGRVTLLLLMVVCAIVVIMAKIYQVGIVRVCGSSV